MFIRFTSLSNGNFRLSEVRASDLQAGRYRLACIDNPTNDSDSSKLLFSVDINPAMALHDGPDSRPRKHLRYSI